jgi:hypothetical protein
VIALYAKLALLMIATVSLFAAPSTSKCVNRIIYVDGSIVGPVIDDLKVTVEVTPDPNWEPQPDISIKDAKFAGEVYFNATKAEGRVRDDCSRVPTTVEVLLVKHGREVNRVRLDVSREFTKNQQGYRTRSPILLRVEPLSCLFSPHPQIQSSFLFH